MGQAGLQTLGRWVSQQHLPPSRATSVAPPARRRGARSDAARSEVHRLKPVRFHPMYQSPVRRPGTERRSPNLHLSMILRYSRTREEGTSANFTEEETEARTVKYVAQGHTDNSGTRCV